MGRNPQETGAYYTKEIHLGNWEQGKCRDAAPYFISDHIIVSAILTLQTKIWNNDFEFENVMIFWIDFDIDIIKYFMTSETFLRKFYK